MPQEKLLPSTSGCTDGQNVTLTDRQPRLPEKADFRDGHGLLGRERYGLRAWLEPHFATLSEADKPVFAASRNA
jgi:hypothetical protein